MRGYGEAGLKWMNPSKGREGNRSRMAERSCSQTDTEPESEREGRCCHQRPLEGKEVEVKCVLEEATKAFVTQTNTEKERLFQRCLRRQ